ncbi:MAG: hypothetical protein NZM36_03780, partial [Aquificaceae bacterium]|nr:hypothetical protein [Aquificaceae bacterium]
TMRPLRAEGKRLVRQLRALDTAIKPQSVFGQALKFCKDRVRICPSRDFDFDIALKVFFTALSKKYFLMFHAQQLQNFSMIIQEFLNSHESETRDLLDGYILDTAFSTFQGLKGRLKYFL